MLFPEYSRILMFDVSNICYRVYNMVHEDDPIVFGGFRSIHKVVKDLKSRWDHIIACFDSPPYKRHEILPTYKSNLQSILSQNTRSHFHNQIELFHTLLNRVGITTLKIEGLESDDLMAQVCRQNPKSFKVLVSEDNDLLQLLDPCTFVCKKGDIDYFLYGKDDFELEYKTRPVLWSMVKAMAGCPSDNIEGIRGIGIKKAIEFFEGKYYDIDSDIVTRNIQLTSLPFEGTPEVCLPPFEFNQQEFEKICKEYKILKRCERNFLRV